MDTSLRYSSDSKSLRIRAKQKISLDSKTLIQAHGELDTGTGVPNYLALLIQRFYPELSASIRVGVHSDKFEKLGYHISGKKTIPLTSSGFLGINIKGRCDMDKECCERKARGALELVWTKLDFQKDQDVRFKVGYEISEKVPYLQMRENNWTINADAKAKNLVFAGVKYVTLHEESVGYRDLSNNFFFSEDDAQMLLHILFRVNCLFSAFGHGEQELNDCGKYLEILEKSENVCKILCKCIFI